MFTFSIGCGDGVGRWEYVVSGTGVEKYICMTDVSRRVMGRRIARSSSDSSWRVLIRVNPVLIL